MAATRLSDLIVPEVFASYMQNKTEELTALLSGGILTRDLSLDAKLAGGGLTFEAPSFADLDNTAANIGSDDPGVTSTPLAIGSLQETAVRINRNQSWSNMNLNNILTNEDPMAAIADLVAAYWAREMQRTVLATSVGIFADNDAAPTGSEHVQYDLTHDAKGAGFVAGTTDFNAGNFISAVGTMGDAADGLGIVFMHSVVYQTAQRNNLIDFVADAVNPNAAKIPMYLNRRVVVDDSMPNPAASGVTSTATGIYHTYIVGSNAFSWGVGNPPRPVTTTYDEETGNGQGQETLYSRVQWCVHPTGHAYQGTAASGGPSNLATTHNLAHAASFGRVYPERKQIKIARLITREA